MVHADEGVVDGEAGGLGHIDEEGVVAELVLEGGDGDELSGLTGNTNSGVEQEGAGEGKGKGKEM